MPFKLVFCEASEVASTKTLILNFESPHSVRAGLGVSFVGGALKERRRRRGEKGLSKRAFLEIPFLLCQLKVLRWFGCMFPGTKICQKPEPGYTRIFPGTKNRNQSTCGCSRYQKPE